MRALTIAGLLIPVPACAPVASPPPAAAPLAVPVPVAVPLAVSVEDRAAPGAAAAVDAFHSALQRGDTDAALGLLAEDALIFESGGVERSKAEYAAHHLGADAQFSQAVPGRVTARTSRALGDLAWVASERQVAGTFRGRTLDLRMTETMVLRRADGGWLITHIHWSSAGGD